MVHPSECVRDANDSHGLALQLLPLDLADMPATLQST